MRWIKVIGVACCVLCLFAGGIAFDIFVVQKFMYKNTSDSDDVNHIEISQNIVVTQNMKPDVLQIGMSIVGNQALNDVSTLTETQREHIVKKLDSIIKLTQANKNICKYTHQVFAPSVIFGNFGTEMMEYNIYLTINCELDATEYKQYEEFVSQIRLITHNDGWLDFRNYSLRFALSDSAQKERDSMLREQTIRQANILVDEYSKRLNTKCRIKSVLYGMFNDSNRFDDIAEGFVWSNAQTSHADIKSLMEHAQEVFISSQVNLNLACDVS